MKDSIFNIYFTPKVATIYFGAIIAILLYFTKDGIPLPLLYPFALLPFLPALFVSRYWFWPSLIATTAVLYIMPGHYFFCNWLFYLFVTIIVAVYYGIRERQVIGPLEFLPFALIVAYMSAVDYWSGDDITNNSGFILSVSALLTLSSRRVEESKSRRVRESKSRKVEKSKSQSVEEAEGDVITDAWGGAYAFVIASLLISIVYFMSYDTYLKEYYNNHEMQRSTYMDPNYQGCIIGMGIIMALYLMLNGKTKALWQRILCIACVVLSIAALFALASRGALLAVVVAGLALIMVSKTKSYVKILTILLGIAMVAYSYSSHYLDLLIQRLTEDSLDTGSNRTAIWIGKIDAFTQDTNMLHWMFGIGRLNSISIGDFNINALGAACHNQYLAHLINYGIVGFATLIYLLCLPIVKAGKENKTVVSIFVLYLALVFMTLEPFTMILPAFFLFYFYTYILATRDLSPKVEESKSRRDKETKSPKVEESKSS